MSDGEPQHSANSQIAPASESGEASRKPDLGTFVGIISAFIAAAFTLYLANGGEVNWKCSLGLYLLFAGGSIWSLCRHGAPHRSGRFRMIGGLLILAVIGTFGYYGTRIQYRKEHPLLVQLEWSPDDEKNYQLAIDLWKQSSIIREDNQYPAAISELERAFVLMYPLARKRNEFRCLEHLKHFADNLRDYYNHEGRANEAKLASNAALALLSAVGTTPGNNVLDLNLPTVSPVVELQSELIKEYVH